MNNSIPVLNMCVVDIFSNLSVIGNFDSLIFCRNNKGFFVISYNTTSPIILHLGYKPEFFYNAILINNTVNKKIIDHYFFETT